MNELKQRLVDLGDKIQTIVREKSDPTMHVVQEVVNIYKKLNPGVFVDMNCPKCLYDTILKADRIRIEYEKELETAARLAAQQDMFGEAKPHKFPKQKRK